MIDRDAIVNVLTCHVAEHDQASSAVACAEIRGGKRHGWFRGWAEWVHHIADEVNRYCTDNNRCAHCGTFIAFAATDGNDFEWRSVGTGSCYCERSASEHHVPLNPVEGIDY